MDCTFLKSEREFNDTVLNTLDSDLLRARYAILENRFHNAKHTLYTNHWRHAEQCHRELLQIEHIIKVRQQSVA